MCRLGRPYGTQRTGGKKYTRHYFTRIYSARPPPYEVYPQRWRDRLMYARLIVLCMQSNKIVDARFCLTHKDRWGAKERTKKAQTSGHTTRRSPSGTRTTPYGYVPPTWPLLRGCQSALSLLLSAHTIASMPLLTKIKQLEDRAVTASICPRVYVSYRRVYITVAPHRQVIMCARWTTTRLANILRKCS